ncbi:MAG: glycine/sarcosine/betaine reductase selenoprotein B family protein [Gemmatimonadota bacterium]
MGESFEEFRTSFFYGSRTDLSFKFLKNLSDDDAARFLQELLGWIGEAFDTGDVRPLIDAAYEAQVRAYEGRDPGPWTYDDAPFAPLARPLAESRVLLMTSSGHFVRGDDPRPFGVEDMTQEEAIARIGDFLRSAPTVSTIPRDTPAADIRVRHGGYDVRSTLRDLNVTFPRDRLVEAEAVGRIGHLADELLSFPGAASQGRLLNVLPEWIARIHDARIDAVILVPV